MPEHGTVAFLENLSADVNRVIRTYAKDVGIVGGMVDFAQGETVLNNRDAPHVGVRDDVGGVEELGMPQSAHRTSAAIRGNNDVTKGALVEALPGLGPCVAAQVQRRRGDSCRIRLRP